MKDNRYKVNQEIVNTMREFRAEGWTYQSIADKFDVSYSTAVYWTNKEQRDKQRIKNAKRRRTGKELEIAIERDLKQRKQLFKTDKNARLRFAIQGAIDEKRCTRHTVKGMDIESAKKLLKSGKLDRPNAKIQ
tara:strand:- start:788 stop:1186 length:399 start_codon:yes stop_codon:yes gene_type:complete